MAKKKAVQPAKEDLKAAAPTAPQPAAAAPAKAPAKAKGEKVWDSSKGYTGTQSDYRPPDTDPVKQTVDEGRSE